MTDLQGLEKRVATVDSDSCNQYSYDELTDKVGNYIADAINAYGKNKMNKEINTENWTDEDKQQLEALIAKATPKPKKVWCGKGQPYVWLPSVGEVSEEDQNKTDYDDKIITAGNGYPLELRHVAERDARVRVALKNVRAFVWENDMWFEPDWEDGTQVKWQFTSYDHSDGVVMYYDSYNTQCSQLPPLESEERLNTVLENCRADIITVLTGGLK